MRGIIYTAVMVFLAAACLCQAARKPVIVQGNDDWTLDVKFENPQQIMVKLPGVREQKRFWYLIITLTNKTGHDTEFYPKCELMTDTFQVIPAGKSVPDVVFEQIKRRHQSKYQFLESLEKAGNKILQGSDNTKDIAIIWPDFAPEAKGITLFISGLSNETAAVNHPLAKDSAGNPEKIYLRKTLELNYSLGGDPAFRSDANLLYKNKRWIMR